MNRLKVYGVPVVAMVLVVLASNIFVQFPLNGTIGRLQLADILTWGAFTYPFAFLVTDLTNRLYGPSIARQVVMIGFAVAVIVSVLAPPLLFAAGLLEFSATGARLARIAVASGTAFLVAQLLDIAVFNRLRRQSWWRAPAFGSLAGSFLDTLTFFSVAFAPAFAFVGPNDDFALGAAPLLGLFATDAPRWLSWALGDFVVKLAIAVFALVPYRVVMQAVMPMRPDVRRA
ncbi:queuosine precursor transporter [Mangrovicella endophytica]|uniref:queuosine precursor transporter n=1 Tax=Mangrovicella endophytica TaxID=2066697 RepID=UPI000C9E3710|nr:queuosine precursor transporter [Mangrovicella endophytica]